MMGAFIFIHILVCVLIMAVILMQSGRGGGLTEHFAAAESMFGAKTNVMMVKLTTVLAGFFLVTCLGLAFLSTKKDKSLMNQYKPSAAAQEAEKVMPSAAPEQKAEQAQPAAAAAVAPAASAPVAPTPAPVSAPAAPNAVPASAPEAPAATK